MRHSALIVGWLIAYLMLFSLPALAAVRAADDDTPTCEEISSCADFDPPAATPGRSVTITPAEGTDFIPIVGECPAGGRLRMELARGDMSSVAVLTGSVQRARFVVPDLPPGEYGAAVYCADIDLGMGVGSFEVVGLPPTDTAAVHTPAALPWLLLILSAASGWVWGDRRARSDRWRPSRLPWWP